MFNQEVKTLAAWTLGAVLLSVMWTGPSSADEIYVASTSSLIRLDTETGAQERVGTLDLEIPAGLVFTPDGTLIAVARDGSMHTVDPTTAATTEFRGPGVAALSFLGDLAAGPAGFVYRNEILVGFENELRRIDLITGAEKVIGPLHRASPGAPRTRLESLAFKNGALVGTGFEEGNFDSQLFSVSPSTGALAPISNLGSGFGQSADFDSEGNLWLDQSVGTIAPPFWRLRAVDPSTGEPVPGTPIFEPFFGRSAFAVRPEVRETSCQDDETSLCLLDGRYRIQTTYEDFAGNTGAGRVVPGDSDTTGLMWFFAPDNWELMVKVIDGCEVNGRVWTFLSATTNVGFTVTVTDVVTGEIRSYRNPLGQEAMTVLDTDSFATCP